MALTGGNGAMATTTVPIFNDISLNAMEISIQSWHHNPGSLAVISQYIDAKNVTFSISLLLLVFMVGIAMT
jgi:hypothetical protein